MNKKVSTILTCGLILGGSLLSSSAFADPINNLVANKAATSVEANTSYVLVQKANSGDVVYGFEKQDDGTIKEVVVPFTEDLKDNQSLKNFAWTIKEDSIKVGSDWRYWYTFHNVGLGIDLGVNADVDDVVTSGTIPSTKFVFESYHKYNGTNGSSVAVMDKDTEYIGFANAATDDLIFGIGNRTKAITFYEVSSKIIEGDDAVESLNGLYNKKGFNDVASQINWQLLIGLAQTGQTDDVKLEAVTVLAVYARHASFPAVELANKDAMNYLLQFMRAVQTSDRKWFVRVFLQIMKSRAEVRNFLLQAGIVEMFDGPDRFFSKFLVKKTKVIQHYLYQFIVILLRSQRLKEPKLGIINIQFPAVMQHKLCSKS